MGNGSDEMNMFRWVWNVLMELKKNNLNNKEFMDEYWNLRSHYDTRNMTEEQIMDLPCNKHLKELNISNWK